MKKTFSLTLIIGFKINLNDRFCYNSEVCHIHKWRWSVHESTLGFGWTTNWTGHTTHSMSIKRVKADCISSGDCSLSTSAGLEAGQTDQEGKFCGRHKAGHSGDSGRKRTLNKLAITDNTRNPLHSHLKSPHGSSLGVRVGTNRNNVFDRK